MLRRLLPTAAAAAAGAASGVAAAAARPVQRIPALALGASVPRRLLSGEAQSAESAEREERMRALLQEKLKPTHLVIQDISGGCGAMYNMEVESPLFQGKTLVAQHRMVNEVLAKEIAEMHGLSLKTKPSKS